MVDPTALVTSLYEHVQSKLGFAVNNGPLRTADVKPGAAEFAITAIRDGPPSASGGTHATWYVEGYFATHHPANTLPTVMLMAGVKTASALNSWWHDPVPQNEPALLSWEVNATNMFVNPDTNNKAFVAVVTVETGFTLLLDLEVA